MVLTQILNDLDQQNLSDQAISFNVHKLNALFNPYPELVVALQVQKVFEWFDYQTLKDRLKHQTLTEILKMNQYLSNDPNAIAISTAQTKIERQFKQMHADQTLILYNDNTSQILDASTWHDLIQNLITTLLIKNPTA